MEQDDFQKIFSALDATIAKSKSLQKASGTLSQGTEAEFESRLYPLPSDDYFQSLNLLHDLTQDLAQEVLDDPIPNKLLECGSIRLVSEGQRPDEYNAVLKQDLEELSQKTKAKAEEFLRVSAEFTANLQTP